ncbi:MAG: hypothetical protein E7172_03195 [Firmicutes bacterium]|nr:hypothetical protein [Bacillota bacterium]
MKSKIMQMTIILFLILLFINYNIVLSSSLMAVDIWLKKVFPYLFIMFIINDSLINLNFHHNFSLNVFVFIASLLSGAPSSAFIINNLYQKKAISKNNANYLLLWTYFSNPLFLYAMFNSLFSFSITLKLILIHYLSNLLIYLFQKKHLSLNNIYQNELTNFNIASSIKKSMNTLIMILGTITFYMVVTNIFAHTFNFNQIFTIILKGFLEITQGLNNLSVLSNVILKQFLALSFISFGGLSIHTQVKCILQEFDLDYKFFLKGRIFQLLIANSLLFLTICTQTIIANISIIS